jgi:hypothetical protein
LELGTWNLELGTWNLELGTWNLELGTSPLWVYNIIIGYEASLFQTKTLFPLYYLPVFLNGSGRDISISAV